ncbi:hypothetical protein ACSMDF_07000 [Yersinia enterocolitica]
MFKLSMQMANCTVDVNTGMAALLPDNNVRENFKKVSSDFEQCRKNIDIKKGSVEFIKEEIARSKKDIE